MNHYNCKVIRQKKITEDIFLMSLDAREIAQVARPGQFGHLRVSKGIDPLLRRPFSIHRVNREKGRVELLYRVIGRGTALMQKAREGHFFNVMGPLGNGFDIHGSFTHALVVAGGIGGAPVIFLIDELLALGKKVTFLYGAREGCEIAGLPDLKSVCERMDLATDDGSMGHHGMVTDLLEEFLAEHLNEDSVMGFVCGPIPMLKRVQEIAKNTSFGWQASIEERMACGVGVCIGCAIKAEGGGYKIVCSEGPVFYIEEIVFDG